VASVTILIGQSWLGLWRDGKLVRRADEAGWQFNAARLLPDGEAVEIAAYPMDTSASGGDAATVMRFDSGTLALVGKVRDPSAGQWRPLPPPVGTGAAVSGQIEAGEQRVAANGAVVLSAAPVGKKATVLWLRAADGKALGAPHRLPPGDWRLARSPIARRLDRRRLRQPGDSEQSGLAWNDMGRGVGQGDRGASAVDRRRRLP
jgi:hypothetical protein